LLVNHVSGIGPKLALAALSGMNVNNFKAAVVNNDVGSLSKISGVGRKTAERMVLELKDRVGVAAAWEAASAGHAPTPDQEQANEAVLALIALGYKQIDASELEQLGHRLLVFQRACNQLYQLSVRGKQPAWIAQYLDAGKPAELVELSRQKVFRDELPRVIRPDLILTENSYIIAEIDSVPGGIGLTGWLNRTYSALGQDVIGREEGMLDGFQKVLPNGGDILVSEESAT